ncbi:hypothetical protein EIN_408560 [Entamoeba invadens IP1]|uniref:Uncharacterized protein n=1 Tax=Entamoeba invadens IP1 TaxID=370355 RepID=A0A0A1TWM8_ENTIV|nr:hypothetical protein EIN_408560 [Entamoeba invadens IP1]ELP85587.1 hypothetical protein EIN_408560 [Entamoeba invadens IP1]|eukprot:XP_004184933.1 hypothetical protein EIN_408560 [Entamoeba invadens IP1]
MEFAMSKDPKQNNTREKELKNYFSYQQGVVVALVNQFYSIELEPASKASLVTETSPKICSIVIEGEHINIRKKAEELTAQLTKRTEHKRPKEKTMKRRFAKSSSVFVNNYMLDILREHNFFFNSTLSKKSNKTFQLERLDAIFYNGNFVMGATKIGELGKEINDYLNTLCENKKRVVLERNNPFIFAFLAKDEALNKHVPFFL